jgi:hypothetical protein
VAVIRLSQVDRHVHLTKLGAPALTVTPSQVVCRYKKNGDNTLSTKVLDSQTWLNLGDGYYAVRFTPAEMDSAGYFFFTLTSEEFDNFTFSEFTIEPQNIFQSVSSPDICVVSGSVRTIGNTVPKGARAVFRPVLFPATMSGSVLHAEAVSAFLNAYGTFSVELVQGATVIAEIEGTGIRAQIEVPYEATADLMSLLPPIGVQF